MFLLCGRPGSGGVYHSGEIDREEMTRIITWMSTVSFMVHARTHQVI
jgi:hypothetical protein